MRFDPSNPSIEVVTIAGGVGGAKMADGLAQLLGPEQLTIIVNTGDDFDHLGLRICPDLDTVSYTLAGIANPDMGWGRADETWNALETISALGGPNWFRLGDKDLGLHLERIRRLEDGETLSDITCDFNHAMGIRHSIMPMTDQRVSTRVSTKDGVLDFQDYFVRQKCKPAVTGFEFLNIETAEPAPGVLESIRKADMVVICPSNPWVSIGPVLAVRGIYEEILSRPVRIAVSPIIRGKALKGPAAKMYSEMGIEPSAAAVASQYKSLINGFVFDQTDLSERETIEKMGLRTLVTDTVMNSEEKRRELAQTILEFGFNFR